MAGMPTDLTRYPWDAITAGVEAVKRKYYTIDWPDHRPHVDANMSPEDVEWALRVHFNFEGVLFSYNYDGQEVELRRPAGLSDEGLQRELHYRGKWDPDKEVTTGVAHVEYSRYEHKQRHIDSNDLDWEGGKERMADIFDEAEDLMYVE